MTDSSVTYLVRALEGLNDRRRLDFMRWAATRPDPPNATREWGAAYLERSAAEEAAERAFVVLHNDGTARPSWEFECPGSAICHSGLSGPHGVPRRGRGTSAYKPVYSPDGSRIAFGCDGRLCAMNADGSNVVVLYEEPDVEGNHFASGR